MIHFDYICYSYNYRHSAFMWLCITMFVLLAKGIFSINARLTLITPLHGGWVISHAIPIWPLLYILGHFFIFILEHMGLIGKATATICMSCIYVPCSHTNAYDIVMTQYVTVLCPVGLIPGKIKTHTAKGKLIWLPSTVLPAKQEWITDNRELSSFTHRLVHLYSLDRPPS